MKLILTRKSSKFHLNPILHSSLNVRQTSFQRFTFSNTSDNKIKSLDLYDLEDILAEINTKQDLDQQSSIKKYFCTLTEIHHKNDQNKHAMLIYNDMKAQGIKPESNTWYLLIDLYTKLRLEREAFIIFN